MSPTFFDLGVPVDICRALESRGITEPFPIQRATIEDALAGRDICGRAPTGSGKTILALALTLSLPGPVLARAGTPLALARSYKALKGLNGPVGSLRARAL